MARSSPIFLFFIILAIVVTFAMAVTLMIQNPPTDGAFMNSTSSINLTQQYIQGSMIAAPNWAIPAVFVALALALIGFLFLFRRR